MRNSGSNGLSLETLVSSMKAWHSDVQLKIWYLARFLHCIAFRHFQSSPTL